MHVKIHWTVYLRSVNFRLLSGGHTSIKNGEKESCGSRNSVHVKQGLANYHLSAVALACFCAVHVLMFFYIFK